MVVKENARIRFNNDIRGAQDTWNPRLFRDQIRMHSPHMLQALIRNANRLASVVNPIVRQTSVLQRTRVTFGQAEFAGL